MALSTTEGERVTAPDEDREDSTAPVASAADSASPVSSSKDSGAEPLAGKAFWFQVGALLLATVVLGTGLFAWWHSSNEEPASTLGDSRDAALIAAKHDIEVMNTLDYRDIDGSVAAWQEVTTGLLYDQTVNLTDEQRQLLKEQKAISTAKVVDAAVVDITPTTATVIASLELTVIDDKDPDAQAPPKRNRYTADLAKVDGEWKLENLQQVAVDLS